MGAGLGVRIARGIARSHGAELTCVPPRAAPFTGAAFLLRLPLRVGDGAAAVSAAGG